MFSLNIVIGVATFTLLYIYMYTSLISYCSSIVHKYFFAQILFISKYTLYNFKFIIVTFPSIINSVFTEMQKFTISERSDNRNCLTFIIFFGRVPLHSIVAMLLETFLELRVTFFTIRIAGVITIIMFNAASGDLIVQCDSKLQNSKLFSEINLFRFLLGQFSKKWESLRKMSKKGYACVFYINISCICFLLSWKGISRVNSGKEYFLANKYCNTCARSQLKK